MICTTRFSTILFFLAVSLSAVILTGCMGDNGTRVSAVKGVTLRPIRSDDEAARAFNLVNEERMRRRMLPLERRPDLDAVAYAHGQDLMRMHRLSHTSSDGRTLEIRLGYIDWVWAGENLARNKGFDSPAAEAVRGWILSPQHRDNMFRPDYRQTGMAALTDPDDGFTYFVQVFITPSR